MAMIPGCLASECTYEEVATEYRSATFLSDVPYMWTCYVLLMQLDLNPPASTAASSNIPYPEPEPYRPSMTAGGKHNLFSLYFSNNYFDTVLPFAEDYPWVRLSLCCEVWKQQILEQLPHSSFLLLFDVHAEALACKDSHFNAQGSQMLFTLSYWRWLCNLVAQGAICMNMQMSIGYTT